MKQTSGVQKSFLFTPTLDRIIIITSFDKHEHGHIIIATFIRLDCGTSGTYLQINTPE